jgi:hypothetical protein
MSGTWVSSRREVSDTRRTRYRSAGIGHVGVRRMSVSGARRGCQVRDGGGRGVEARVSGTQRYQNAGVRYAAVSDAGVRYAAVSGTRMSEARCQARGGARGASIRHAAVSERGCQVRGGVRRGVEGASVKHAGVRRTVLNTETHGVRRAVSGTWVSSRRAVSGTRRCRARCQACRCRAHGGWAVSGTWRYQGRGYRVRRCQAHGCQRRGVRHGAVPEARVSGTQRCQNAGVGHAAVSGCGCQVRGGVRHAAVVVSRCGCRARGGVRCKTVAGCGVEARVSSTRRYQGARRCQTCEC